MSTHRHRTRRARWPTVVVLAITFLGACMNDDDRTDGHPFDVLRTGEHHIDLSTPPTRDDVGLTEGSTGLSVAVDESGSEPLDAGFRLPNDTALELQPYRVVIEPRVGPDRSGDLTRQTAPPGRVNAMFAFDTVDQANTFLRDVAGQLGEHRGALTDEYIAGAVETMTAMDRHPRPAVAEVGYVTLSVNPRSGTPQGGRPAVQLIFTWSAMPENE